MSMTRKHYVAFAATLAEEREMLRTVQMDGATAVDSVVRALADMFEDDNPNFDRERFLKACKTVV